MNFFTCSKIVLVAIQDAGSTYVSPALNALKRLGAKDPILKDHRGSFALVGYAQPSKPSWITQEQQKRYEGPSEVFLRIPLVQSRQPRKNVIMLLFLVFIVMAVHSGETQNPTPLRFRCLGQENIIKLALWEKISRWETQWITIIKFPMHKRRINLNFPVTVLTFGLEAKDLENLRRFYGAVFAGPAHARDV